MKFRTANNILSDKPNERQSRFKDMKFRTANNILSDTPNERQLR